MMYAHVCVCTWLMEHWRATWHTNTNCITKRILTERHVININAYLQTLMDSSSSSFVVELVQLVLHCLTMLSLLLA